MENELKITVVTVCYNAVETIERTMLSVLGQTYPNIEYIIIDGGSTDGTVDIIKKYADRLAYWVSEPDKGIYDAMNKGILGATGDYINFMNAGDSFVSPEIIKLVAENIKSEGEMDVVYGNTYKHTNSNRWEDLSHKPYVLRYHGAFCHQSGFVKVAFHKKHLFDLHYKYMADFDFFHKAYMQGATFLKLDVFVAEYNAETGASLSHIEKNYDELDEILMDTDTTSRKFKRRLRRLLGCLKRIVK